MPTATGTGTSPPRRQAQKPSMNCSLLEVCRITRSRVHAEGLEVKRTPRAAV
jgi:hypothetical protein